MPARAWGVEHLDEVARVQRIIDAGCDQFGGESRPELVVQLVESGLVPEGRIDLSVRRLLREKFLLGLFEAPFVDAKRAELIVGNAVFMQEGLEAQRRAYTLLLNHNSMLPLRSVERKVYAEGLERSQVGARGFTIVDSPSQADVALLRLKAPYEPRPGGFEKMFHAGSLEFSDEEQIRQVEITKTVPTIVDIYLDRPAIISHLIDSVSAVLVSFGSSDEAFLDVVCGKARPEGRLPFDIPSSMQAVEDSRSDVPFDTINPLFRFGDGLNYRA